MKVNQHHALHTNKVLLLPYSAHHVPTYHAWMQDPSLQIATASEPLTLDEEYAMQRSWREDADKLTFIVCLPLTRPLPLMADMRQPAALVHVGVDDAPERMVGDVNLFLSQATDDDDDGEGSGVEGVIGEIELMIARKDLHRQGYGRAALLTFTGYIIFHWPTIYLEYKSSQPAAPWPTPPSNQEDSPAEKTPGPASGDRACAPPSSIPRDSRPSLRYLRVKIHQNNLPSIALFESIGYKRTRADKPNYFGEVELRWRDDGGFLRRLKDLPWMKGDGWDAGVLPFDGGGNGESVAAAAAAAAAVNGR
ncbi:hypothetical protein B0A55_03089 [Friedmanniomyces simplex]|uniref:N-acetyltransferase domain-containing protein n=1 Tax=Friedmanniomyces simplex TaxID=329884 RepID=A0A4U0XIQ5_9PEZI|nr:hypothetical protein B0A55_03089 [Friedmanniomyces simplex]